MSLHPDEMAGTLEEIAEYVGATYGWMNSHGVLLQIAEKLREMEGEA